MRTIRHICIIFLMIAVGTSLVIAQSSEEAIFENPDELAVSDSPKEQQGKGKIETTSKKQGENTTISLDLKGMHIINLLRMLAQKTGLTIVPSKGLNGRIDIFLNNVSFLEALDVILATQNLACKRRGGIIYIMTAAEYKRLYGHDYLETKKYKNIKLRYADPTNVFTIVSQLKSDVGKVIIDKASGMVILLDIPERLELMADMVKKLDCPTETVVFELNSADPIAIKKSLEKVVTPDVGQIIVDVKSSRLIVEDSSEKMKKIRTIIANLDVAEKEVFIEAEIIQINMSDRFNRGIDWQSFFNSAQSEVTAAFPVTPALATSGNISIGTLQPGDYNIALEFLQEYGDLKILSSPRLAVLNNQEARIMVGTRDVYVTQTLSQAESTTVTSEGIEFIDVGVKLKVVPKISNDGFVTMEIKPEVSNVSETITTSLGSRIPIVATSEVETFIKVKDKTMIMIAGLREDEKREDEAGIPWLHRIPFIGGLFGSKTQGSSQTELIVFITPHIITGEHSITKEPGDRKMVIDTYMSQSETEDIFLQELENMNSLPETGMSGGNDQFLQELEQSQLPYPEAQTTSDADSVVLFDEKLKGIK
ncbi:MAG: hypothetical protein GY853_06265 [PVC group bacterium]|nr:hypothetical protein [PVC group bacterium]